MREGERERERDDEDELQRKKVCENRRALGVELRSSVIVYTYILQFEQAIVRVPLWNPLARADRPHKRYYHNYLLMNVRE
jgi:hypothetical protein